MKMRISGLITMLKMAIFRCFIVCFFCLPLSLFATDALIAVAANFKPTAEKIVALHRIKTGFDLGIVSASSGKLYTQIKQGAPFDVFLSADQSLPKALVDQGLAIKGSRFTYAVGQLAVVSYEKTEKVNIKALESAKKIAIANPIHAPYGKASVEVLEHLHLFGQVKGRLVQASNVGQVLQYLHTSAVDLGFVPYSLALLDSSITPTSIWLLNTSWYSPLLQDAVLIKPSKPAESFMKFLRSSVAKELIHSMGYR